MVCFDWRSFLGHFSVHDDFLPFRQLCCIDFRAIVHTFQVLISVSIKDGWPFWVLIFCYVLRSESGSIWRCSLAFGAYILTQLCKYFVVATIMIPPPASIDCLLDCLGLFYVLSIQQKASLPQVKILSKIFSTFRWPCGLIVSNSDLIVSNSDLIVSNSRCRIRVELRRITLDPIRWFLHQRSISSIRLETHSCCHQC